LLTIVGVVFLASCGGEPATTVLQGQDVTLKMFDNRYEYDEIRIPVGGSIEFLGAGRNPHNAKAADGSWSTEDEFGTLEMLEGDSAVISFDSPGTYVFFCSFHGNAEGSGMAGTIIVGDSG
jgi:plastocyanin